MESESPKPCLKTVSRLTPSSVQPKAIDVSEEELVDFSPLCPDEVFPLLGKPRWENVVLAAWIKNNYELVNKYLQTHGAILFRGFKLRTEADFEQVVEAACPDVMPYMESATPRTRLNDKIYTSTEFPADQNIALHNELSYVRTLPMKIFFFCAQTAKQGGETPIADVRKVLQRIPEGIRNLFRQKGWMLVRNFGDGFGPSWQSAYHTKTKSEAEDYFRSAGIEFEWKQNGRLRTKQIRPAVARHPRTGEMVWFNHVGFWHVSSLEQSLARTLLEGYGDDALPYNTFYGDGTRIDNSIVDEIREAYRQETMMFHWNNGDLLMLDNMLVAHGRTPYIGTRRVLVSMGEPFIRTDL